MLQLNYKTYGSGPQHLIILHGLFGMLDNWHTLATRFGETYTVWLVDQRNHGKSPHTEDFNYTLLADDLLGFMDAQGIERAHLIGHSMGGKTVMQFSLMHPERIDKLIVVDIAPKGYDAHHNEIIDALKSVKLQELNKRSDAEDQLAVRIPQPDVRQFLLKNLTRETEGYRWKMNLAALVQHYPSIIGPIDHDKIYNGPVLFIRGGRSDYILPEDEKTILWQFPQAQFVTFPGIGHWVNAEAPAQFYDSVMQFLAN